MPSCGEGLDPTDCRRGPAWSQACLEAFLQTRALSAFRNGGGDVWKQIR